MNTPPRILVATALDDASAAALRTGARLAAMRGASMTVLHVVEQDHWAALVHLAGGAQAEGARRLHEEQEAELAAAVDGARRTTGNAVEGTLVVGAPHDEVARVAGQLHADLVVLGQRSTANARGLMLGTTAERVLDAAAWPVLSVRREASGAWRRVLVPVDFSARSRMAIGAALRWAPDAKALLVHAYEVPFEMKLRHAGLPDDEIRRMRTQARAEALALLDGVVATLVPEDARARVEVRAVHGEPAAAILAGAAEWGAELVVMAKRGRGVGADLLLGSVTRHVLGEAPCDVLVTGAEA